MRIGPLVRALMPLKFERAAASLYRAAFVDMGAVAATIAQLLPPAARVLDIGGGDGELLNRLLTLRSDVHVTMVDVAPSVGRFVKPEFRAKVALVPQTTVQSHAAALAQKYDAAIVVDVVHHVTPGERHSFLACVAGTLRPGAPLLVKDVEPGHFRATLGYWCDKYLSGDMGVELIPATELINLLDRISPGQRPVEAGLFSVDSPNYLVRATMHGAT